MISTISHMYPVVFVIYSEQPMWYNRMSERGMGMGRNIKRITSLLRESDNQIRQDRDLVRNRNLASLRRALLLYVYICL